MLPKSYTCGGCETTTPVVQAHGWQHWVIDRQQEHRCPECIPAMKEALAARRQIDGVRI